MRDLTRGSISKQLVSFAAPMLIGNLFQQLYSIVDALVVGRYVGGGALAAVGVSMGVIGFLTSMLIGLVTGSSIVISQFYGAKQHDRLKSTVSVSIIFLAGLSVLISVLGVVFAPQVLQLLNADPEILDDALTYMRIIMGGMVFSIFYNMQVAYLRALGDTRIPLFILIFTVCLSGALTFYCVIVLEMGVFGAAISTVFAQMIAMLLCYLYTRRRVPLLLVEKLAFDFGLFKTILRYGIPASLQFSFVTFAHLLITRLINSFGYPAMAAITAVGRIDSLAIMPIATISMALSTFVAQNMGADLEDRAKKGMRVAIIYMLAFAVCISIILMSFAPQLISLFLNQGDANSTEILDIGRNYMSIMVIFYFLFAILFGFNGFFRGVGDAVIAMVFPIISLSCRTASAYILVLYVGMGPEALAWSIPIGWGVSGIIAFIYYKKRLWVGKLAS